MGGSSGPRAIKMNLSTSSSKFYRAQVQAYQKLCFLQSLTIEKNLVKEGRSVLTVADRPSAPSIMPPLNLTAMMVV